MTTQPVNPSGRVSVHAHEAEVEAVARAIRVAQASDPDDQRRLGEGWDAYLVDHDEAEALMRQARAAHAAAMPPIRERLAQEVEAAQDDAIERAANYALTGDTTSHSLAALRAETFGVAARTVRGVAS